MRDQDDKELFKSAAEEYKFTIENQIQAYEKLKRWNVDLIRIVLLSIGTFVAITSTNDLTLSPLLIGLIGSLGYSLWCSVSIHRPHELDRGPSPDFIDQVHTEFEDGTDLAVHYERLGIGYSKVVERFTEKFKHIKEVFRRALWSAICGILFLFVYFVTITSDLAASLAIEVWLLFLIPIVVIVARDISDENDFEV
ncbi:hypothetical protein PM022_08015 [Halorubrum ezzemoulense]|uniref:hypothetical protein n=1 Tax=Halorubrum ezzemoulense TaxID=337243 RepID=UPI00233128D9|nr:hypothetical protein [Halorubrum ezzemoulense]MDB2274490.1 hypothetical protein [Halorubrum ezzemoulense]